MRGYYEGRYRDKCASDMAVELRQHIYRRSGIAVWGGVGSIYHKLSDIRFDRLLPEYGIGYRWEFKRTPTSGSTSVSANIPAASCSA